MTDDQHSLRRRMRPSEHAQRTGPPAVRIAAVIAVGLAVGALTSVLQTYLDSPWLSLVNSASPWLAGAFLLGALWRDPRLAALSGVTTGLLELTGYYATAQARGYPVGHAVILFWAACAAIGGPIFGLAGWAWWRGPNRLSAAGASALPAAFFAEATVAYAWRLNYLSSALLLAVIGLTIGILLGLRRRHYAHMALWLVATLTAGVVAELILGLVYDQTQ